MEPKSQITSNVSPLKTPITISSRGRNGIQPFVNVLSELIDLVKHNENQKSIPLNELEYQQLVSRLDELLDIVNGEENHDLAHLMHFVGTLIRNYEKEHIPKLTEI